MHRRRRELASALVLAIAVATVTAVAPATPAAAAAPTITVGTAPSDVVFSRDGTRAYVANETSKTVSVINVASSTVIATIGLPRAPHALAVSPDGTKVYVAAWDLGGQGEVRIIGVSSNSVIGHFNTNGQPLTVAVSPDNTKVYTAANMSVEVYSAASRTLLRYIDVPFYANYLVPSPDGRSMYVGTGENSPGPIVRFDVATDTLNGSVGLVRQAHFAPTPDGSALIIPVDTDVWVQGTTSEYSPDVITTPSSDDSLAIAITPVGSHAYLTDSQADKVSVIDVGSRTIVDTIDVGNFPWRIAISPDGTKVYVANGGTNTISVITRSEADPDVPTTRISGADRYATAVGISQAGYPTGANTVWIATGLNYPDALSAAAAAAGQDAPLLLTPPDSLPATVRTEIERLSPDKIVVVGGVNAVSAAVRSQLRELVDAPLVERMGATRYETAASIVRYAVTTAGVQPPKVYIATGENFPDALSSGGVAGSTGAPVLLVPGTSASANAATVDLLEDLDVTDIAVVGGLNAITRDYMYSIWAQFSFDGARVFGDTRYTTSQNLNGMGFATADTVYLATGTSFPDALAGAALAGAKDSPLYIVPRDCVPRRVLNDIERLQPSQVVLLGGPNALSAPVASLTACA